MTPTTILLGIVLLLVFIGFCYLCHNLLCVDNSHIFVDITAGKSLAAQQQLDTIASIEEGSATSAPLISPTSALPEER